MKRKVVRTIVAGRVQGVWFRGWTVAQAEARGLDGWVRNRSDGTVEAVFAGPSAAVDSMVDACAKGPPSADVTEVSVEPWEEPDTPGFEQKPSL